MSRQSSGQKRLLATSRTSGTHLFANGQVITPATMQTHLDSGAARMLRQSTVRSDVHYRGARFQFFGNDGNNETMTYRLWLFFPQYDGNNAIVGYVLALYGTGTATFSTTVVGVAATLVTASELMADGLTWALATDATSPEGPGTVIEAARALGTATVYNPASDADAAYLEVPDMAGAMGFIMDVAKGTGTEANALFDMTR